MCLSCFSGISVCRFVCCDKIVDGITIKPGIFAFLLLLLPVGEFGRELFGVERGDTPLLIVPVRIMLLFLDNIFSNKEKFLSKNPDRTISFNVLGFEIAALDTIP